MNFCKIEKLEFELNPFKNGRFEINEYIYRINSIKEHYECDLLFILPCLTYHKDYKIRKSNPSAFISQLLGHEGLGSLYSFLSIQTNDVTSLVAGSDPNDAWDVNPHYEVLQSKKKNKKNFIFLFFCVCVFYFFCLAMSELSVSVVCESM